MKTIQGTGSVPILKQEITSNPLIWMQQAMAQKFGKLCLSDLSECVIPALLWRYRRRQGVLDPVDTFFRALRKGRMAINLYTNSKRLIFSCRMTWDCSGSVNLYSRQILTLPRKANNIYNITGPGTTSVMPCPGRLKELPRPLLCNARGRWPILSRNDVSKFWFWTLDDGDSPSS